MFPIFDPDIAGAAFDTTKIMVVAGLYPQSPNASGNGTGIDFNAGTGQCFAIQLVGAEPSDTINGKIQESTDNRIRTDVADGAFIAVSSANSIHAIAFRRTNRYLRYSYTFSGVGDFIACIIAQANQ
jgi:hypothetical protein